MDVDEKHEYLVTGEACETRVSEYKKVSPCGDMALLPSTAIRLASDLFSTIPITTQETLLIDSFGSATSIP